MKKGRQFDSASLALLLVGVSCFIAPRRAARGAEDDREVVANIMALNMVLEKINPPNLVVAVRERVATEGCMESRISQTVSRTSAVAWTLVSRPFDWKGAGTGIHENDPSEISKDFLTMLS